MEYAIFPMRVISISQRYTTGHCAWDLTGSDTGIDYWHAPCRVRVLRIMPYDRPGTYANTVLFGSCDGEGQPAKVMCEDGVARILTFACTHMDSVDKFGLEVDKVYESGTICYQEGSTGKASGNHVHMEVAEGWQTTKPQAPDGQWLLPNLTNIANVFYRYKDWNVIGNHGANGYTFKEVSSRIVDSTPPITLEGAYLKAERQKFRVRNSPVSGTEIAMVEIGQTAEIKEFLGIQSDGYQWAKVKYNGILGYSQIDTYKAYLIQTRAPELNQSLYLNATKQEFRIRSSVVNGTELYRVKVGGKARITELLGIQSDGYQWAKVYQDDQGISGYSQIDTNNCYTVTAG
jgi:hypothetical protein